MPSCQYQQCQILASWLRPAFTLTEQLKTIPLYLLAPPAAVWDPRAADGEVKDCRGYTQAAETQACVSTGAAAGVEISGRASSWVTAHPLIDASPSANAHSCASAISSRLLHWVVRGAATCLTA